MFGSGYVEGVVREILPFHGLLIKLIKSVLPKNEEIMMKSLLAHFPSHSFGSLFRVAISSDSFNKPYSKSVITII